MKQVGVLAEIMRFQRMHLRIIELFAMRVVMHGFHKIIIAFEYFIDGAYDRVFAAVRVGKCMQVNGRNGGSGKLSQAMDFLF